MENMEKNFKSIRNTLIVVTSIVSVFLVICLIFHFYLFFDCIKSIDLIKLADEKVPSSAIWHTVGWLFSAMLDVATLALIWFLYIIITSHNNLISKTLQDMKISCPGCGTKLDRDVLFCPNCGTKLLQKNVEKVTQNHNEK